MTRISREEMATIINGLVQRYNKQQPPIMLSEHERSVTLIANGWLTAEYLSTAPARDPNLDPGYKWFGPIGEDGRDMNVVFTRHEFVNQETPY